MFAIGLLIFCNRVVDMSDGISVFAMGLKNYVIFVFVIE